MILDEFDRKILRAVQRDATVTVQALSEAVGLSHTPCWRRLKRLEAEGVIAGRVALIDPAKVGLPVCVFAHVSIKSHSEEALTAFERAVEACEAIIDCHEMSGETDYLLRIVAPDVASYERFLKTTLLHLPNVGSVNSSFALKEVKHATSLPV